MVIAPMARIGRLHVIAVLGAAAALLASCAKAPPPQAAAYTLPVIELPSKLVDAASVYEATLEKAAATTPDFTDGSDVTAKLKAAAAFEPVQFQRGQGAYAAIVALQDPAFVAGIRAYATDAQSRDLMINEIMQNPAYVVGIKGADSAAGLIVAALTDKGARVRTAGERVRQAAYDVQKQAWSKAPVIDRDGRLAAVKALAMSPYPASMEASARFRRASTGEAPLSVSGAPVAAPYSPTVVRGLAVAALAVLGRGGESNADYLWEVLAEPNQTMCLRTAKLNVNQCLAVAKPYYEDVFCLGVHVLMDTGSCVIKAANAPLSTLAMVGPGPAPANTTAPLLKAGAAATTK